MEKIADRSVVLKGSQLAQKTLFFGVCGSIGAVESVRIIRELRRHSARIVPVMTSSAQKFITPLSVSWAADQKAVCRLSEDVEHLADAHGMILCPATWNTLVQISLGMSHNALTTCAAIVLARKLPLFIVPTLHLEFAEHPLYDSVMAQLESLGAQVWFGPQEEGRSKMPDPESLVTEYLRRFHRK